MVLSTSRLKALEGFGLVIFIASALCFAAQVYLFLAIKLNARFPLFLETWSGSSLICVLALSWLAPLTAGVLLWKRKEISARALFRALATVVLTVASFFALRLVSGLIVDGI